MHSFASPSPAILGDQFNVDLTALPTMAQDRPSFKRALTGVGLSLFLLVASGATFLTDAFKTEGPGGNTFSIVLLILGALIGLFAVATLFRYNEIEIGPRFVVVRKKGIRGTYKQFMTSLKSYTGVRYRTAVAQCGRRTRMLHIIDLLHTDPESIVPLYVGESGQNVRQKWREAARKLNLPPVVTTAYGLETRNSEDLEKTLRQLVAEGKITETHDAAPPDRRDLRVRESDSSVSIVTRRLFGSIDRGNIHLLTFFIPLVFFVILLALSILMTRGPDFASSDLPEFSDAFSAALPQSGGFPLFPILGGLAVLILGAILLPVALSVRHYGVSVTPSHLDARIYWIFGEKKAQRFFCEAIESLDVVQNEDDEQYYLVIHSREKCMLIGKGLSYNALQWLRSFLLQEVTRPRGQY